MIEEYSEIQIVFLYVQGCGFGCQLHHVVFCLTVAYGTQRTLVLSSKGWRYNKSGWEQVFLPVGSCLMSNNLKSTAWPGLYYSPT